ncbi:hypothetical protein HPB51_028527 [Rhipicephalus microplus]|uniref:CCHC-type domain-containing protein n=1 Tax=Rhipicephalus microplus TaxID=6941 RepID=A0A9J6CX30_RHIMP|nr:hypothetical protein HPB51_028527 [Rhipicephalus microplus]
MLGTSVVGVQKLGNSNAVVLPFEGRTVPYNIFYRGGAIFVRHYRKTTPVCMQCGTVGHRTNVCANPNIVRCSTCGAMIPEAGNKCRSGAVCVAVRTSRDPSNVRGSTDLSSTANEDETWLKTPTSPTSKSHRTSIHIEVQRPHHAERTKKRDHSMHPGRILKREWPTTATRQNMAVIQLSRIAHQAKKTTTTPRGAGPT